MATNDVEELAKQQVAQDEARITGSRRTSQSLGQVFAEFWRHPSPYILSVPLVVAIVGRVLAGPGEWWSC